jgi:hypothetical protein
MRTLLHALLVAGVFIGADVVFNNGVETAKLVRKAQAVVALEAHQARATVSRAVHQAHPRLAVAKIER